jgi:uncharacterized protein YdeI (YjbR/CyaY-like superfamily)
MEPIYFASPDDFRAWLAEHHTTATEVLVGFHKRATGTPSMTWPQSVDQALCFGWIDGVRRRIDDDRYTIRFTPRKHGGNWSRINVEKVEALRAAGLLTPAGLAAYEARREDRTGVYSFERADAAELPRHWQREFKADKTAWAWWSARAPSYRRAATHWVVSAKKEATRRRRFETLVDDCAQGRVIKTLAWSKDARNTR